MSGVERAARVASTLGWRRRRFDFSLPRPSLPALLGLLILQAACTVPDAPLTPDGYVYPETRQIRGRYDALARCVEQRVRDSGLIVDNIRISAEDRWASLAGPGKGGRTEVPAWRLRFRQDTPRDAIVELQFRPLQSGAKPGLWPIVESCAGAA